jgi:hypothetical protein
MVLSGFERRLERLVEGAFAKAFRSGLQPVELGRRIARQMDAGRTLGVRGPVSPNRFRVELARDDAERFKPFADALARELADAAREHARDEGYLFLGPVVVELTEDAARRRGTFDVRATIEQSEASQAAVVRLPDGRAVPLQGVVTIGRLADCAIHLSDSQSSRRHAEVRPVPEGHLVVDLGSTNGTLVNGVAVHEHVLSHGDTITIGTTELRYEASG